MTPPIFAHSNQPIAQNLPISFLNLALTLPISLISIRTRFAPPPPAPPKNPSPNASIFGGFLLFSRRDSLGERGGRKPDSQRNQRIRAGKGGMDSRNWRFLPNRLVSMSKKRGGHFETRPLKWSGKSVVLRAWKRRKKFDFKKTGG